LLRITIIRSQNGWEVYRYENGNVKDSTLYRNDTFAVTTRFYHNGKVAIKEKYVHGVGGYSAVTFTPDGKKTGEIKNGNGTIIECDSLASTA
jgi:antitoxin component YwqK of YwqJK toxin-antitoxin module